MWPEMVMVGKKKKQNKQTVTLLETQEIDNEARENF